VFPIQVHPPEELQAGWGLELARAGEWGSSHPAHGRGDTVFMGVVSLGSILALVIFPNQNIIMYMNIWCTAVV
jgi:hypothetical protein